MIVFLTDLAPPNAKHFYSKRNIPSPSVIKQRRVSYSYRTATTSYPCYIPVLGDFRGSWSYKTYPMQKYGLLSEWQAKKRDFFLVDEHEADLQEYKKEIPYGNGIRFLLTAAAYNRFPEETVSSRRMKTKERFSIPEGNLVLGSQGLETTSATKSAYLRKFLLPPMLAFGLLASGSWLTIT